MNATANFEQSSAQRQAEFPLAVAVCAWCKPRSGAPSLTVISHGICPRHLRQMRSKVARKLRRQK
jgi:hypothetical protein